MTVKRIAHRAPGNVRANLRYSIGDGVGYSAMVGFGETYLSAFALALGFSEVFTGLLATLPLLTGAILQLVSPHAVRWLNSRRRWVLWCAALQTTSFVPLVYAAWRGRIHPVVLLAAASLYWGANFAAGPTWTSWMESLVPSRVRAAFFARRTGWTQLSVILALLGGGFLLRHGEARGLLLSAFALTFTLAAASRAFTLTMLRQQTEPEKPGAHRPELRLRDTWRYARARTEGSFLHYLLLVQLAVSIAGPYFVPYMLRRLAMPYSEYTLLLASAFMAKVAVLLFGGSLAQRLGPRRLLLTGGLGIVPIPALWLVSSSFAYLLALQVMSGMYWACYELGMFLLIFERIRIQERTAILTLYNLAHAVCSATGSLIGAVLFTRVPSLYAYAVIFGASSVGRALAVPLLLRLGPAPKLRWSLMLRTIAIRPSAGALGRPLIGSQHPIDTDGQVEGPGGPGD